MASCKAKYKQKYIIIYRAFDNSDKKKKKNENYWKNLYNSYNGNNSFYERRQSFPSLLSSCMDFLDSLSYHPSLSTIALARSSK